MIPIRNPLILRGPLRDLWRVAPDNPGGYDSGLMIVQTPEPIVIENGARNALT